MFVKNRWITLGVCGFQQLALALYNVQQDGEVGHNCLFVFAIVVVVVIVAVTIVVVAMVG